MMATSLPESSAEFSVVVAPLRSDMVTVRVVAREGVVEACGVASLGALRDLSEGHVSALQAGELSLARGKRGMLELRVVQSRLTLHVDPAWLAGVLAEVA